MAIMTTSAILAPTTQTATQEPTRFSYDAFRQARTTSEPVAVITELRTTSEPPPPTPEPEAVPAPIPYKAIAMCRLRGGGENEITREAIINLKPVSINYEPGAGGTLNAYSTGVVQGLQRSLVDYAASQGRTMELTVDGVLSPETVSETLAALADVGLPAGVTEMPTDAEGIARICRAIASKVASAAGVAPDFIPSETRVISSALKIDPSLIGAGETTVSRPILFSKRNISLGALGFLGFLVFRRR